MSWFLFKNAPAVQQRGKKIEGYKELQRDRINLNWGINQDIDKVSSITSQQNYQTEIEPPITIDPNTKIMTETSQQQKEELEKLLFQQDKKKSSQAHHFQKQSQIYRRNSIIFHQIQQKKNRVLNDNKQSQALRRIKYLQNNLLPQSKRQNMAPILDHRLNGSVKMGDSRVSGRSSSSNRKNESKVQLGNYNVWTHKEKPSKDFSSKLKQRYDYDDNYKKRMETSGIRFG